MPSREENSDQIRTQRRKKQYRVWQSMMKSVNRPCSSDWSSPGEGDALKEPLDS